MAKYKLDNEKILEAQTLYLTDRDKYAKLLYKSIFSCAKRFIRYFKEYYKTPQVDFVEKAHAVCEYIFIQYLTRPTFTLKIPSGYIRLRALAVMFRHKKIDEITDYKKDKRIN